MKRRVSCISSPKAMASPLAAVREMEVMEVLEVVDVRPGIMENAAPLSARKRTPVEWSWRKTNGPGRMDGNDQGKPLLLAVDVPQEELGFGYAEPGRRAGCPEVRELEGPRPSGSGGRVDSRLLLSIEAHDDGRKCASAKKSANLAFSNN